MTHSETKADNLFERHSWKALLVIGIIIGLFGLGDIIQGMDADPAIGHRDPQARQWIVAGDQLHRIARRDVQQRGVEPHAACGVAKERLV